MQTSLSRLVATGPQLACAALAGLILLECARAIVPLLPEHAPKHPPLGARNAHSSGTWTVDVDSIVAGHLFGAATDDARDTAAAAATMANLVLQGTLATNNPSQGIAIITADGSAKVYRVGEDLMGADLHSVYADRVTLDRAGKLETLMLRRSESAMEEMRHFSPAASASGMPDPRLGQHLADLMVAEPSVDDQSDALLGFVIKSATTRDKFTESGLRSGDLLTAVNGVPLAARDRQHSQEIVDTMLASDGATVSVLRNGRSLDLTLTLRQ